MRRVYIFSLLIISSLLLTSCIDILEDFHFNKDESGSYELRITVGSNLAERMGIDEHTSDTHEHGDDNCQAVSYADALGRIVERLQQVEGLSQVKLIDDKRDLVFGYQFEFENMQALNQAFITSAGEFTPRTPKPLQVGKKKKIVQPQEIFIEFFKNTLVRHQNAELGKLLAIQEKNVHTNQDAMSTLAAPNILHDLNYTAAFHFKKKVRSTDNPAAIIQNKSVRINCQPFASNITEEPACQQALQIDFR